MWALYPYQTGGTGDRLSTDFDGLPPRSLDDAIDTGRDTGTTGQFDIYHGLIGVRSPDGSGDVPKLRPDSIANPSGRSDAQSRGQTSEVDADPLNDTSPAPEATAALPGGLGGSALWQLRLRTMRSVCGKTRSPAR